ncbi:DUF2690 domain-containing protein [Micromonospora sp. WMMA1363]|uniref:helix-turn-helix domain-containing protein n=1 Tax=Micromonospora sp. WMMA1363 TaxID=3053985 RepID=UPI00259C9D3B|nr:XRE family transcriptional regulator [Micromonospora sp. WMMA1363]MDM4722887.1 DUF2690 domain-containing protein [Micromonospora sp. WMMA1363]
MARAERQLDPTASPVQAFAADLRRLRDAAGRPTYTALARRAHRSATSLSEAAGGRKLPTLDTTLAYVRALGGDEVAWARRWHEVARSGEAVVLPGGPVTPGAGGTPTEDRRSGAGDDGGPTGRGPDPRGGDAGAAGNRDGGDRPALERRSGRRSVRALVLAAAVVAGLVTVPWLAGGFRSAATEDTPPVAASPPDTGEPRDGADPKDAGCAVDPAVATVDTNAVLLDGRVVGTVELRYSPACGASWPRFLPVPAAAAVVPRPAQIQLTVTDGEDPTRFADFAMDYAGISAFGNILTSTRTCVWAQVRLSGPGWTSPRARTGCWRGATQVRPIP